MTPPSPRPPLRAPPDSVARKPPPQNWGGTGGLIGRNPRLQQALVGLSLIDGPLHSVNPNVAKKQRSGRTINQLPLQLEGEVRGVVTAEYALRPRNGLTKIAAEVP